jgi:hypothetical protein
LEKYCEKRGEQNNGGRGKISNKGKLFRISELRNDIKETHDMSPFFYQICKRVEVDREVGGGVLSEWA